MTDENAQRLDDLARECWRAETRYMRADHECEGRRTAYEAATQAVHEADAARRKAWAMFQVAFVANVQSTFQRDPEAAQRMGEVLSWFRARASEVDPDGRAIYR